MTRFRRSGVKVRPLWEVTCEQYPCNGNADEGEIYDNRAEAEEARRMHIQTHESGAMSGEFD